MTSAAEDRLRRLLGGADLQGLRRRLRARYERSATADEFTLSGLTLAERRALEEMLGRAPRAATSMRLRRSELDAVIARAGLAPNLHAALESLDGPLLDRKRARLAHAQAWNDLLDGVEEPRLRALAADPLGAGVLKRLAGNDPAQGAALLENARRVLARLPARGMPLAQLAAESLGDSHALDDGQAVAAVVLRACRVEERAPTGDEALEAGEEETRRAQWARLGITVNELAAPVLCLNLTADGDTPAATLARVAAERGEPLHLSLRTLLRYPPPWNVAGRTVYVCENASIVAIAADRLGRACAPLVCTDGMPGAAPQTLLRQLAERGARLRYHGDFDWPGIAIGNFVTRRFGAAPWRFGAPDYAMLPRDAGSSLSTAGRLAAMWDAELEGALAARGLAVHEEAVVESLLQDLGSAPVTRSPSNER